MPVESATYLNDLNTANPASSDEVAEGDNHLRLLKTVLKASFPDVTGPLTGLDKQPFGKIGKCRFAYVSSSICRLSRFDGKHIFINGTWYEIPSAGTELAAASLASNDTTYYVYAYMSGSTLTLEASATAPTQDTTYGHTIKTSDASRSLVGLVRKTAGAFVDTLDTRFVRTYYNDPGIILYDALASPQSQATTTAAAYSGVDGLFWDDELVAVDGTATFWASDGTTVNVFAGLYLDGAAQTGSYQTAYVDTLYAHISQSINIQATASAKGLIQLQIAPVDATEITVEATGTTYVTAKSSGSGH